MKTSERPHLLMVPYYFPPLGMGGVQRPLKFARYLPEFGWNVTVITPVAGPYHARDEFFLAELPESVHIERVRTFDPARWMRRSRSSVHSSAYQSNKSYSLFKSLQEWLCWPDDKRAFVGPAVRCAARLAAQRPFDLVWTTAPPPSTHLVGMRLQRRLHIPWVADFRDPWFLRFDDWGPTRWHTRYAQRLRSQIVSTADSVVAASEAIKAFVCRGDPAGRPPAGDTSATVIYNGFDESDFSDARPTPREDDAFSVLMYGTVGTNSDPEPLFSLLREWTTRNPAARLRVRHVGLSLGVDLPAMAARYGLRDRFQSLGYLPHKQSIQFLLSADLIALPLGVRSEFEQNLPGRIFEMLRSLRPVLLLASAESEAARLLRPLDGCWTVRQDDLTSGLSALDAIVSLARHTPVRPVSSIKQYERREQTRMLATILDDLKSANPRAGAG